MRRQRARAAHRAGTRHQAGAVLIVDFVQNTLDGLSAVAGYLVVATHGQITPMLGVLLDIGVLEGTRFFQGYRMIVFGGLVAVLLVFRPRGLLDERMVLWIRQRFS
jgi:ABC-type branched-subunit amino acid transport system permease subunit